MKLSNDEITNLSELLTNAIHNIENSFEQYNIHTHEDVMKSVENGNYEAEEIYNKLQNFKSILKKLDNEVEQGASLKQLNSLESTATKRKQITKDKIINALNILEFENNKMTVSSVSRVANISFNTAKQYKKFIEDRELNRQKTQVPN